MPHHWKNTNGDAPMPPAAVPPIPRHHSSNDVGARLARVEEHLQFAHHDRNRVERESKERARDLASAIVAMREMIEAEMAPIRSLLAIRAYRREMLTIFGSWGLWCAKLLLAAIVVLATVRGWLTPEQAKVLGGWLGLPS